MSVEIERAFLGAVITEPTAWGRAKAIQPLSASDFMLTAHQTIFARMEHLADRGEPLDVPTLTAAMDSHGELENIGGAGYLAVLLEGTVPENIVSYARTIRKQRKARDFSHLEERLGKAKTAELRLELIDAMREALQREGTGQRIRSFDGIPDIISMDIQPLDYLVPALRIARNTITLWTGSDGDGKTMLAESMAVAVAGGDEFLGMPCQPCSVLYLDLGNPAAVVQSRLRAMLDEEETAPRLRVWGTWNEQQPPQAGSELLLAIGK